MHNLVGLLLDSLDGALDSTLDSGGSTLGRLNSLLLDILGGALGGALEALAVHVDTGDLDNTNASEEEVDGGKPMGMMS